jgi:hypothetical protein
MRILALSALARAGAVAGPAELGSIHRQVVYVRVVFRFRPFLTLSTLPAPSIPPVEEMTTW